MADTLQNALELDSMSSTHPISVDVYNPGQITEIFDGISYDKVRHLITASIVTVVKVNNQMRK